MSWLPVGSKKRSVGKEEALARDEAVENHASALAEADMWPCLGTSSLKRDKALLSGSP